MYKFVRSLITEWRKLKLPFADETVVVAVSGGADSLGLLLALEDLRTRKKLDLRLVAAHFNHKLRGRESDADEEFLKDFAADRNFELAIGHGSIGEKGNVEQNAREARYEFLTQTAENLRAGYVLTAHTMNDQAETFLLNLIRGSGFDGLSGMQPVRELRSNGVEEKGNNDAPPLLYPSTSLLARPLLRWAQRADTENFCREQGVEFRYDTMNEDMSFKRVRVRKMLLPMLREFNPKIIETLCNTADLMRRDLNSGLSADGPAKALSNGQLSVRDLYDLEEGPLKETIRSWLKECRGNIRSVTHKHIEAIGNLARSAKSGRTVELPGFGLVIKQKGSLAYKNIKVDK